MKERGETGARSTELAWEGLGRKREGRGRARPGNGQISDSYSRMTKSVETAAKKSEQLAVAISEPLTLM